MGESLVTKRIDSEAKVFGSAEDLKVFLNQYLSTEGWGLDGNKSLHDLVKEIVDGESTLCNFNAEVARKVSPVFVEVYYNAPDGKVYILKELIQEWTDDSNRVRQRDNLYIGEKKIGSEKKLEAAKRAVFEELGITVNIDRFALIEEKIEIEDSRSYPGLRSIYEITKYRIFLNNDEFDLDGYVEDSNSKITYFIWLLLKQSSVPVTV